MAGISVSDPKKHPGFSSFIKEIFSTYWTLIKPLQTGLLVVTGMAGAMSGSLNTINPGQFWLSTCALFGAIIGSTILNMVYDRDVDALMQRTSRRPLPSGKIRWNEALVVGIIISILGLIGSFLIDALFGIVVFAGWFFDLVIYTIWLKRRTPFSVVIGGLAGGMPILAGRALAVGSIDLPGVLLSMAILLWIPTHNLTFSIQYIEQYKKVNVPTFPDIVGVLGTRWIIAGSSFFGASVMIVSAILLGLHWIPVIIIAGLGLVMFIVSMFSIYRPSQKITYQLYKYASLYMLASMILIMLGIK